MKKKIIFTFIGLILIFGIIFGIKKSKKDTDLTHLKVAEVTHSVFYAPLYAAIENGYFKEEGLEIELILTPGADKVSAAVLSNTVDIGFAGTESASYIYDGKESDYLVTFAGLTKRDGQFILSRNCEKEFKLEDLYGSEILVGRLGGMPALNFLNAMKNANLDVGKMNLNYAIDFASLSGSFIGGIGDYVNLFEPNASSLVKNGNACIVESIGRLSGEVPYTAFYARKSYLEKNEETLKKFTRAIDKGLKYVLNTDSNTVAKSIQNQFMDSQIEDIETIINNYKKYDSWLSSPFISEESFVNLTNLLKENSLIQGEVPYSQLIHNLYE